MKKIALVTGGGSGLGYSLSKELLRKEIDICLIGRDEPKLLKAQKTLKNNFKNEILYFSGDISDEQFVKKIYTQLQKEYDIQYLFNCAGTGQFGPIENNDRKKIDSVLSANLIGLILMSSNALKAMEKHGGIIINIMSTASLKGNPNESIYCAAKWGARGFTEAMKAATKGTKIKVVSVFPGGMNTEFWTTDCGMMPDTSKFMIPEEVAKQIVEAVSEKTSMYVSEIIIDRK